MYIGTYLTNKHEEYSFINNAFCCKHRIWIKWMITTKSFALHIIILQLFITLLLIFVRNYYCLFIFSRKSHNITTVAGDRTLYFE